MVHIKNIKVRNPKNVLVQIPRFISLVKWGLTEGKILEVYISENSDAIIIKPGSCTNKKGERMA